MVAGVAKPQQFDALSGRLRSALEDAPGPALVLKEAPSCPSGFRIVWANRAFVRLTGHETDALRGEPIRVLQGPETSPAVRNQLRAARDTRDPIRVECMHYRSDGQAYVSVVDLAPLPSNGDEDHHWLSFHHDVTAQRKQENALLYEATHDPLTGLANRAALQDQLQGLLEASSPAPAALLHLDLDRFKLVNDSLGHREGDRLLVKIARLLQENVPEEDTAVRIGGDEFAVCLPQVDPSDRAHAVARRIYEALNQPIQLDQRVVFTPPSIGMVVGVSEYDTVEAVLRDADTAMYAAKDDVNRSVAVYDQVMTQKADEQLSLDAELRQGLERNEFVPFFQPILNLRDGSLHGFEVLARWHHPERGLVGPAVFLDAAETTGLIAPIGHQVVRSACQVVSLLRNRRGRDVSLSLTANFSRHEFFRTETHTFLSILFEEYDVRPEHFTMEISERTAADISGNDGSAFSALKALGVDIILDDFGTGFSSLQSLRRLPVDGLKIDKDLLTEVNGQAWDRGLIDLVVQIGHRLGQVVTAEGIETLSQLRALRKMECSRGQGFLFARPVPTSQLEALLENAPWMSFWND